ncbi:hypothetical protein F66182_8036 [Fusarium sp. NRRL 66182]|nr:hypothetical protein F66182_8036 [Fusarium sp. NRRL 66182]
MIKHDYDIESAGSAMALTSLFDNLGELHLPVLLPASVLALVANGDPIKFTAYLISNSIYNLYFHPLRKFPGPKLSAISIIPYIRMFLSGHSHREIRELHQKYGPIVRIGPNDLSLNHPDAMKDLRGHRQTGTGENSKDDVLAKYNADNMLGANRQDHRRFRRALAHGFSNQSMMDQQPIITDYVNKFIRVMHEECYDGTKPLDIAKWFNFTTFDIIGDLSFGEGFGCLDAKDYHPWVNLILEVANDLAFQSCLGRIPGFNRLARLAASKGSTDKLTEHGNMSKNKLRKRLALGKDRSDFVDSMMRRTESSGSEITFEELASNSRLLVFAGSETTATSLSATIFYLTTNPESLKKLVDEVRSSFKSEDDIVMVSVQRLSYLQAVLNESLRLFPPIINGTQRVIRDEGDTIVGHYVPGGASVDVWQWAVHHNPEHFTQPDNFIPERWLDDPRFENDAKRALQPFSIGPRDCIGKK